MDEKTSEQLASFLKLVNESLQSGKDFVLEQAPLVVQEMVAFGRVWHGICALFGAVLVCCGLFVAKKVYSYFKREGTDAEPAVMLTLFPIIGTLLPGAIICGHQLNQFVLATFAPRLYVLEQIGNLLK